MQDAITEYTLKALKLFGDRASETFYEKLKEGKFQTTFCSSCCKLFYPPRVYCPDCTKELTEWQDLPQKGTLYAWAQHDRGLRFNKPDVLGLVDLEGVPFRVLGKINIAPEKVKIGQPVKLAIQNFSGLHLLTFDPL